MFQCDVTIVNKSDDKDTQELEAEAQRMFF